jgi:hypothetical protein
MLRNQGERGICGVSGWCGVAGCGAGPSHDAGRSPLGAPPWRFWASGPRFSHRCPPPLALRRASDRSSELLAARVPGRRIPEPPEASRLTRRRRTPLPAAPSGSPPETPLNQRGCESSSIASDRSREKNTNRSQFFMPTVPHAERNNLPQTNCVMAGLVPAIHVFTWSRKDVDARDISAFTRVFRRAMRGRNGQQIMPLV